MKNRITIEAAQPEDGAIEAVVAMPATSPSATILYFHGFGSSQDGDKAELFRSEALARGLGFVSLDFQGHGRSDGSMLEHTVSRCLADVDRMWQALDAFERPVYQVGSSMGGLVALWHAAQQPGRVFGQSLIAPALGIDEMMSEALGPERMANWEREGTLVVSNELGTFELGWAFVSDLGRFPVERLVELHSVSTLVFQGKLDDRVPWRRVSAFADSAAAKTRLELIDDGDHRLLDRMDWIVEEVFEHLGACNPRPRAVVQ